MIAPMLQADNFNDLTVLSRTEMTQVRDAARRIIEKEVPPESVRKLDNVYRKLRPLVIQIQEGRDTPFTIAESKKTGELFTNLVQKAVQGNPNIAVLERAIKKYYGWRLSNARGRNAFPAFFD